MRDSVIEADSVEMVGGGLVDLSELSFKDVVKLDDTTLHGTVLGHVLQRMLADSEDTVSAFNSAHTAHVT